MRRAPIAARSPGFESDDEGRRATGHAKHLMTSPNVVFLTTSGPLGPTFKPSRRRRNPCRTGVTCIEQLAHYPPRGPESDLGSIRRCRAGGKGTAFKPCATTAIEGGDRPADPQLPGGCLDRRARPSVRGPPDHGHPPPRPGRHRPTAPGPQDDRRLSCPGGRTVRARPVARGRGKRVRSAPTDPGPGTPPSRSTHSTPSGLDQMTASAADVQDPGATPPPAGPCERPQANNYTSNDIPKTGPSNERERCHLTGPSAATRMSPAWLGRPPLQGTLGF